MADAARPKKTPTQDGSLKYRPLPRWIPATLYRPGLRAIRAATDRGWFGRTPLESHVVVCGFPRAGTTLLQLMIQASVDGIRTFHRERWALDVGRHAIRNHRLMLSKKPDDQFKVDAIRDFYSTRPATPQFLLTLRDPRSVLTSRLATSEPHVSPERFRRLVAQTLTLRDDPDVCVVRYEDNVADPNRIERQLTDLIGWQVSRPFAEFHRNVSSDFDTTALNGVRKADAANAQRWRQPQFAEELRTLVMQTLPELPDRLIELGYETDDAWASDLTRRRAA